MRRADYLERDATALAELVHRGEVTPEELTAAAIERIDSLNSTLNAVVETSFDLARAAALKVDRRSRLAGVPFLAKDMNIDVRGLHLTSSCRWLSSLPAATTDAPLAARWRKAGLSILGRTNTPEFAGEFVTEPTWRGPTKNPWDLARSPGGSSGGAAAAVASGMVPLAHATDSGGSIRVPAAACGLVGFKPSRGLNPVGPHLDELAGGLDCEHVLTRSVRDTALMLELTAGPDSLCRAPLAMPASWAIRDVRTLRIGVTTTAPGGMQSTPEIAAAVLEAADVLRRAGHSVGDFEFPASTNIGTPAAIVWMSAVAEEIDFYRLRMGRDPQSDELEALTRASIEVGAQYSALDYVRARRALSVATFEMATLFERFDILVMPTTADLPPLTGQIDGRTEAFDLARWNAESYGYAPFTEIFNATGQPAASLPLATSATGLPIGIQFAAALGQDIALLSLATWFERELPWESRLAELRGRFAAG